MSPDVEISVVILYISVSWRGDKCVQWLAGSRSAAHPETVKQVQTTCRYFITPQLAVFFTCRVSMLGRCRVWPRLVEFSGGVLSGFTLSRFTLFTKTFTHKTGGHGQAIICSLQFFTQLPGSQTLGTTDFKFCTMVTSFKLYPSVPWPLSGHNNGPQMKPKLVFSPSGLIRVRWNVGYRLPTWKMIGHRMHHLTLTYLTVVLTGYRWAADR